MKIISKNNIEPNVLSDVLLAKYVMNKEENIRFKLDTRWNTSDNFDEYVILYKIALVLLALLSIEQKNKNFEQVRLNFEKSIFSDGNVQKLGFYFQVKPAMDNLGRLFEFRGNPAQWMNWATSWLKSTEITETNPTILFQLAMMWVDNYVTVTNYLNEYDPN